ncbi:MAG: putative phage protein (TIGR02216 family) [Brevundimonas sp.]|jgi:uncharacterized phage protein (TIGR02216 family)
MWAPMLRAALAMGIPPGAFWRLSLKEWRMLTAVERGPAPMGRGRLDELMARWPDGEPAGD